MAIIKVEKGGNKMKYFQKCLKALLFSIALSLFLSGEIVAQAKSAPRNDGTILVEPEYDTWTCAGFGRICFKKGNLFEIDSLQTGETILSLKDYQDVTLLEGLIGVKKDGKWGIMNDEGKQLTTFKFDYLDPLSNGTTEVCINQKSGIIGQDGKMIVDLTCDKIEHCYHLADFTVKDKIGIVKKDLSIIEPQYDQITYQHLDDYDENSKKLILLSVRKGDKWGVINELGTEILPLQYDQINLYDGLICAKSDDKWSAFTEEGIPILKAQYDSIIFENGFIGVEQFGKWGIFTSEGKRIANPKYSRIKLCYGMIAVTDDGSTKWYFIDKTGNKITKAKYDYIISYSDDIVTWVQVDGKWGLLNDQGKEITKLKYEDSAPFFNGFAIIEKDGKFGYLKENGKEIVKPKYDLAEIFHNGTAKIGIDKEIGFINENGKEIASPKYDFYDEYDMLQYSKCNHFTTVIYHGNYGVINQYGAEIIVPQYDFALFMGNNLLIICQDEKYGILKL